MADTQIEITPQELKMLPQDSYQLIDTRDDASIAYGMANGAIHIPQEAVVDRLTSEPELLIGRTAILFLIIVLGCLRIYGTPRAILSQALIFFNTAKRLRHLILAGAGVWKRGSFVTRPVRCRLRA